MATHEGTVEHELLLYQHFDIQYNHACIQYTNYPLCYFVSCPNGRLRLSFLRLIILSYNQLVMGTYVIFHV